jgi:hypothetical protein
MCGNVPLGSDGSAEPLTCNFVKSAAESTRHGGKNPPSRLRGEVASPGANGKKSWECSSRGGDREMSWASSLPKETGGVRQRDLSSSVFAILDLNLTASARSSVINSAREPPRIRADARRCKRPFPGARSFGLDPSNLREPCNLRKSW